MALDAWTLEGFNGCSAADDSAAAIAPERAGPLMPGGSLSGSVRRTGELTTLRLVGEVDLSTLPILRELLGQALAVGGTDVDVDMAEVSFCDGQGLAALLAASESLAQQGRQLSVRAVSDSTHRVFSSSDLTRELRVDHPVRDTPLTRAVASVLEMGSARDVLDASLRLVVTMAQAVVQDADGASITLPRDGRLGTVAASNDVVLQMDNDQYETGEGPCLDAAMQGQRFEIHSLSDEQRWPSFVPRARARGIRSILSTPMIAGGFVTGALNVYSLRDAAFAEHETEWADQFAAEAARVVQAAPSGDGAIGLNAQITQALQSREAIARAQGAVMQRDGVSDAVAYARLRDLSRSSNQPLYELCVALVDALPTPPPGPSAGGSSRGTPSR